MVQLTLPKNSKITEGKTWKRPTGARTVTAESNFVFSSKS